MWRNVGSVFHVKHADVQTTMSETTRRRLEIFAALVVRWSSRIQLVAPADLPALWPRHILDSLQLVPLIPERVERAIDIGSGAGFPGLVLSIAADIPFDLIESDKRKAAFLLEAARETAAPVMVHPVRVEAAALSPAPLLTARALAPLSRLLALAAPLLLPGGTCLFPKGRSADTEIADAATTWRFRCERIQSHTHPEGQILRITELAHV